MPDKSFRVDIYDVRVPQLDDEAEEEAVRPAPFVDSINNACLEPLESRYKIVNAKGRRLEHHRRVGDCYLLNFLTFEYSGPGRSETSTPAVPNNLNPDEYFTVETAALFDAEIDLAFIESSLSGMRYGSFVRYFTEFSDPSTEYLIYPRTDNDAAARARTFQTIRGFTMHVRAGPITDADRRAGVDPFKLLAGEFGAGVLKVEFRAERRRDASVLPDRVWRAVDAYNDSDRAGSVSKLELYGRAHDDEPLEPIDLIQHRERYARNLQVNDTTRAVPHDFRWENLLQIRQEFLA